jgi:hypothetical protein
LAQNQLSSLPPEFGKLSNLCMLNLKFNSFEDIHFERVKLGWRNWLAECYCFGMALEKSA